MIKCIDCLNYDEDYCNCQHYETDIDDKEANELGNCESFERRKKEK